MTIRNGILGRVLRLEQAAPATGNQIAFRERLERAQARVDASLTPEEQARRQTPQYLAEQAESMAQREAAWAKLGRRPTLAERILSVRES